MSVSVGSGSAAVRVIFSGTCTSVHACCALPSPPPVVGGSFTGLMSKEIVPGCLAERKMLPVQSVAEKVKASAPYALAFGT